MSTSFLINLSFAEQAVAIMQATNKALGEAGVTMIEEVNSATVGWDTVSKAAFEQGKDQVVRAEEAAALQLNNAAQVLDRSREIVHDQNVRSSARFEG